MPWRYAVRGATWLAIVSLAALHLQQRLSGRGQVESFPSKPIQVVVPYKAGGGTDLFARLVQRAVAEQGVLAAPLVIVNRDGGSGTIGSRYVKGARSDGYTILCLHDGIMTSQLSGMVNYGPSAFEAIAQTGDMVVVVVTHQASGFTTLEQLLRRAKEAPGTIRFGTNLGSPAHFAGLILESAYPGAKFQFVASGGGANRYALLAGEHLEVGVFSLSEFLQFRGDGKLRALGALSEGRHELAPEIPTASELGIPAVSGNGFYWWAPQGTPPPRLDRIANALEAAMDDTALRKHAVDGVFRRGPELAQHLEDRTAALAQVSSYALPRLPDFPAGVSIVLAFLGVGTVHARWRANRAAKRAASPPARFAWRRTGCLLLTCVYVTLLRSGLVGFLLASVLFVAAVGWLLGAPLRRGRWWTLGELALLTALSLQVVFSQLLHVALP